MSLTAKLLGAAFMVCQSSAFVACSDMLETSSNLVEYEKDNTLNHPVDSFYTVMGIIEQMQRIADRTVLLGEVRGDLMIPTESASADLKRLSAFDFSQSNKYNMVSDYYAVINNCNYFLAHVDTTLQRRGRLLFKNEYAAVKGFRAWTYLELVKAYGEVPLVTQPLMTEREAEEALHKQPSTIKDICDYFIADITPYAKVEVPSYSTVGGHDSRDFFIPMQALLGDLCLWAGRYEEAARWYNSYLNDKDNPVRVFSTNRVYWGSITEFQNPYDAYNVTSSLELLSYIPMETRIFDGIVSDLDNVYNSTQENNYYFQMTPSTAMRNISAAQINCIKYETNTTIDTVYAPRTGLTSELLVGDLRLKSNFSLRAYGSDDPYSEYSSSIQYISKLSSNRIATYRSPMVYLRYAEALNRAGYPQSAFAILKYGLCSENTEAYVDSLERTKAGELISFDKTYFTRENTIGIHSRGSGDSECNAYYVLPTPATPLATYQDTVNYQIPLVEDMIIEEMALEGAFEGYRYFDLLRLALRRGDAALLADPISRRNGTVDDGLRTLLMDQKNWFLPLP